MTGHHNLAEQLGSPVLRLLTHLRGTPTATLSERMSDVTLEAPSDCQTAAPMCMLCGVISGRLQAAIFPSANASSEVVLTPQRVINHCNAAAEAFQTGVISLFR